MTDFEYIFLRRITEQEDGSNDIRSIACVLLGNHLSGRSNERLTAVASVMADEALVELEQAKAEPGPN